MASFVKTNKNTGNTGNTGGGYTGEKKSDREYVGAFIQRDGQYGTFHKALIDDYEYYLTPSKKLDDNGNPMLILRKGGKVEPKPQS